MPISESVKRLYIWNQQDIVKILIAMVVAKRNGVALFKMNEFQGARKY